MNLAAVLARLLPLLGVSISSNRRGEHHVRNADSLSFIESGMLIFAAETLAGMVTSSAETVAARSDRLKRGEAMVGKKQAKKASATSITRGLRRIDTMLNGYTRKRKGLSLS